MRHEIPTHLTVEDKVIGPLTMRQFLFVCIGVFIGNQVFSWLSVLIPWYLALGIAALIFIVAAIVTFVPIGGRTFEDWFAAYLRFSLLPKVFVWRRHGETDDIAVKKEKAQIR